MQSDSFFSRFTSSLGESLNHWAQNALHGSEPDHEYNRATWGDPNDGFLSSSNQGLQIGSVGISPHTSLMHSCTIAQSGLGKTTSLIFNTLLQANGTASYLVYDESRQIHKFTSGYLSSIGYNIVIFDLDNPDISIRWNCLDYAKNPSDLGKISSMLLSSIHSQNSDPFWSASAEGILNCYLELVMKLEPEKRTISFVKELIMRSTYDPTYVDGLFAKYADEKLMNRYKYNIGISEKTLSGIYQSIMAATKIFDLENVQEITSQSTIKDLNTIRTRPTVVYLFNSLKNHRFYASLIGLFLTQVCSALMEKVPETREEKRICYFLLDEVTSLAHSLKYELSLWMSNVRKYMISIHLILQEWQSLKTYFHEQSENIYANCYTKIFFTSQNLETATKISSMLGNTTIERDGKEIVQPLYSPTQIRQMPSDQVIVLAGNKSGYKIPIVPFYKIMKLNMRSKIPPVFK